MWSLQCENDFLFLGQIRERTWPPLKVRFFGTQKWPIEAILSVHFRVFMSFLQDAIFASCLFICGKDSKTRSLFQGQKTNHSSSYLEIKKCSMWKWFLVLKPNKGVYLATLWKWGFLGLRNSLLKQFFLFFSGFSCHFYKTPFLPAAFSFLEKIQKPAACFKDRKQTIMIWTS